MSRRADVPPNADILIGWCVGDRYELDGLIGRGTASLVFRAKDLTNGATVAAKLLFDEAWSDAEIAAARHASRIEHPGVTRVLDAGLTEENIPYLITELHEGHTLGAILERGQLTRAEIFRIFLAAADAIAAAHAQDVMHGNIKPSNVFVTSTGHIKVVDFGRRGHGVVRPSRAGSARVRAMLRVLQESGPEQAAFVVTSGESTQPEDDVRALGALLLDMLTPANIGTVRANRIHELRLGRLGPVADVIARTLSKGAHRPKTVEDFAQDLTLALMAIRDRRTSDALDEARRRTVDARPPAVTKAIDEHRVAAHGFAPDSQTRTGEESPVAQPPRRSATSLATARFVTPAGVCAEGRLEMGEAPIPTQVNHDTLASSQAKLTLAAHVEVDSIGGLSVAPAETRRLLSPASKPGSKSSSRRQLICRTAAFGVLFLASCLAAYAGLTRPTPRETAARERGALVSAGAGKPLSEPETHFATQPPTERPASSAAQPTQKSQQGPKASGSVESTPTTARASHDLASRPASVDEPDRRGVTTSRRRSQAKAVPSSRVTADDMKAPLWR
jgi:serine/threonine protein kinase